MSIMIAAGGISAALLGKWTMKVGHRRSIATGGAIYGLGWLVVAGGVHQHRDELYKDGSSRKTAREKVFWKSYSLENSL